MMDLCFVTSTVREISEICKLKEKRAAIFEGLVTTYMMIKGYFFLIIYMFFFNQTINSLIDEDKL